MARQSLPPRLELARLPTPIEPLPALSEELGVEVHVKRDDLTGTELSGNKIRKLEYVLARALADDADLVLTCGGAQSNHCRATAIAARKIGLDVELFLRSARDAPVDGNLFLDLLVGAAIHPLTPETYRERDRLMRERAEELGAAGRRAFVIPEGASTPLGAFGYVRCVEEIVHQAREAELDFDVIVVAVGSGGTLAGLVAGAAVHGFAGRILGIPVCDDAAHFRRVVTTLLEGMRSEGWIGSLPEDLRWQLIDGHVGAGYGQASDRELAQIRDLAVLTGLILDPVYTNKAFSGLLSAIRNGTISAGSRALFVHTGGLLGLLPFRDRIPGLIVV